MKKIIELFVFSTILFLVSCTGDQGPVGPQGVKGDKGAVGAAGAAGTAGANSSASVIYSDWIDRPFPGTGTGIWTITNVPTATQANFVTYNCSIPVPKLTQEIVDKGTVIVYMRPSATASAIYALPYQTDPSSNSTGTAPLAVRYDSFAHTTNNTIGITVSNLYSVLSGGGSWLIPYAAGQYRYVLIPGAAAGRKGHVDMNDYEAVKAAYNIPD